MQTGSVRSDRQRFIRIYMNRRDFFESPFCYALIPADLTGGDCDRRIVPGDGIKLDIKGGG